VVAKRGYNGSMVIAYADTASGSGLTVALVCLGLVAVVGGLALVPVVVAWARRHRRAETIVGVTILWAGIAAVSLLMTAMDQMKWSRERDLRIRSGYYDPAQVDPDAPKWPWKLWAGMGVGYAGIVGWAAGGATHATKSGQQSEVV
jgi:hypothetical protein